MAATGRPISMTASRSGNPRDRAASTSPCRVASSSRIRRPAKDVAVIAPPIRIPATGTTATPCSGTVPLASTIAVTGSAPPATARPASTTRCGPPEDRSGRPVTRPAAVPAATVSMSATNAATPRREETTASSSSETAASYTVARRAATRMGRCCPSPDNRPTATASPVRASSTRARRGPSSTTDGRTNADYAARTLRPTAGRGGARRQAAIAAAASYGRGLHPSDPGVASRIAVGDP